VEIARGGGIGRPWTGLKRTYERLQTNSFRTNPHGKMREIYNNLYLKKLNLARIFRFSSVPLFLGGF